LRSICVENRTAVQVFVYEFITGGGFLSAEVPPPPSLVREGTAMRAALAADFGRIEGCSVTTLLDARFGVPWPTGGTVHRVRDEGQVRQTFDRLAAAADWTVVIAPEFDGHLTHAVRHVLQAGGRLLSPGANAVELASDKQRTAERLSRVGVPVPEAHCVESGEQLPRDFPYPAVLKPLDGAGSLDVELVASHAHQRAVIDTPRRLERFCSGTPASVAVLCGPRQLVTLPACRQHLSDDGRFTYLGGSLPLSAPLAQRAARLTKAAVETLDDPLGYLGVDLVLGEDPDGREDVVIEINPRLTTSYVGLRAACRNNLAAAMVDLASGRSVSLSFREEPVQFEATGRVCVQNLNNNNATRKRSDD